MWSRDGKQLFYIPGPGQLVVVHMTPTPTLAFGNPAAVSRAGLLEGGPSTATSFDVMPDGRLLAVVSSGLEGAGRNVPQMQIVLNWFEELKQRVSTR